MTEPDRLRLRAHVKIAEGFRLAMVFTPLSGLFDTSRPSTIVRRVWAIVVDAINAVDWRWSSSHVSQECLKGIQPAVTDANTPRSVSVITVAVGIAAALLNVRPRRIFRGLSVLARFSVLKVTPSTVTTASSGVSTSQDMAIHYFGLAAIAEAIPVRAFAFPIRDRHDKYFSEAMSSHVNHLHARSIARLVDKMGVIN